MNKESNWWDYPQKIKYWEPDIDYVMFIDENGTSEKITDIIKKITNNTEIDDNEKYFTITGCIFTKENYVSLNDNMRLLKNEYWNNGYYYDTRYKQSRYVCLHSRDIRRHDGAFNDSIISYSDFMNDLSYILHKTNCKIISVSINLEEYARQGKLDNVYEKAFDLLLERYIYATDNNKKGLIMLESRGKKEDKNLLKHIYDVIHNKGQKNIKTKELEKKIKGVYFNPKWYGGYSATFAGLEIADLFSYPIHQYVKYKKENLSFSTIKDKIEYYPEFMNKGIKIYPKEKDD